MYNIPYSQFFPQSVNFSISLSELLLNLSAPITHLSLQQQTGIHQFLEEYYYCAISANQTTKMGEFL